MKILYLLKQEPDETVNKFIDAHSAMHEVTVTDIRENKNYPHLIELIERNDRIISW